jgi:hypothetical protein
MYLMRERRTGEEEVRASIRRSMRSRKLLRPGNSHVEVGPTPEIWEYAGAAKE